MYNMFYQVAYATHHLSTACQLQHFDMRFDNIRVKQFHAEPKDFFCNGVKNFLVKIGDWGQCEFNFGDTRPVNESVPRDPNFRKKVYFPSKMGRVPIDPITHRGAFVTKTNECTTPPRGEMVRLGHPVVLVILLGKQNRRRRRVHRHMKRGHSPR